MSTNLSIDGIDQLPFEQQVTAYRERLIAMRQLMKEALPIVEAFDANRDYDDPSLGPCMRQAIDLNKGVTRALWLPSWKLDAHNLPDDLSKEDLWSTCLDFVLEMNREYGVSTCSYEREDVARNVISSFGKTARDPLSKLGPVRHTRLFLFIARFVGAERLQKFVNRNSQYYRPFWMADVVDTPPRPLK